MSARSVFVLLAVIVLGLLLVNGPALSRFEPPCDVIVHAGPHGADGDDDDDPDNPGDLISGDDDNWDRPVPPGHKPGEAVRADGGGRDVSGPYPLEERSPRPGMVLRVQFGLLFRTWMLIFGVG